MVKNILLICYCCIFISCNPQIKNFNNKVNYNWKLDNKDLKKQILLFLDSVNTPRIKDKFVKIVYKKINDDLCEYSMEYCVNILSLVYEPPHLFFYLNNNLICIRINYLNDFSMSNESLNGIMKIHFPKQYAYYEKNGDYPPPITSRKKVWILQYSSNKFIDKRIIYDY